VTRVIGDTCAYGSCLPVPLDMLVTCYSKMETPIAIIVGGC